MIRFSYDVAIFRVRIFDTCRSCAFWHVPILSWTTPCLIIGNTCLLQYCTNIFVVYLLGKRLTRRSYKILEFENRKHHFSCYLKLQIKLIVTQCWQKKRGTWTASPKYREHIEAWIKWLPFHRQQYVSVITGNSIVVFLFFYITII